MDRDLRDSRRTEEETDAVLKFVSRVPKCKVITHSCKNLIKVKAATGNGAYLGRDPLQQRQDRHDNQRVGDSSSRDPLASCRIPECFTIIYAVEMRAKLT